MSSLTPALNKFRKGVLRNPRSDFFHKFQHEMQIMNTREPHPAHFFRNKQMMQIAP